MTAPANAATQIRTLRMRSTDFRNLEGATLNLLVWKKCEVGRGGNKIHPLSRSGQDFDVRNISLPVS
jgi:hypothetical protein